MFIISIGSEYKIERFHLQLTMSSTLKNTRFKSTFLIRFQIYERILCYKCLFNIDLHSFRWIFKDIILVFRRPNQDGKKSTKYLKLVTSSRNRLKHLMTVVLCASY